MKKGLFFAALFAASMSFTNAFAAQRVDVVSTEAVTSVNALSTYNGTAAISKMNGVSVSGNYAASFDIDATTGEIEGNFSIGTVHDLYLVGNLSSGASGTISTPYGTFDFNAVFTGVSFSGNTVVFTCTATLQSTGTQSVFTFTGSK